jgi:hypothetical protein
MKTLLLAATADYSSVASIFVGAFWGLAIIVFGPMVLFLIFAPIGDHVGVRQPPHFYIWRPAGRESTE